MKDNLGITDTISFQITKETEVVREGRVGILYSPGHGVGWYTWHRIPELLRDPEIIYLVECREKAPDEDKGYFTEKIIDYCNVTFGENHFYEGAEQLEIEWIEIGDKFRITEYDGFESLEYLTQSIWLEA